MWWILLVAIYESNIDDITFSCGLQLGLPSSFTFANKINLALNNVMVFSLMAYSLAFYIVIFHFFKTSCSRVLIQRSHSDQSMSYMVEAAYILFRQFLRSFSNGLFIADYKCQIFAFATVDVLNLILLFKARKYFRKTCIFLFCYGYSISITAFDFFFLIQAFQEHYLSIREIFSFALIIFLAFFTIMLCIATLVD